jgi:hypothetical protein
MISFSSYIQYFTTSGFFLCVGVVSFPQCAITLQVVPMDTQEALRELALFFCGEGKKRSGRIQ